MVGQALRGFDVSPVICRSPRIVVGTDARESIIGASIRRQRGISCGWTHPKVEESWVRRICDGNWRVCVPLAEEPKPKHANVAGLGHKTVCKLPANRKRGMPCLGIAQVRRDGANAAKVLDRKW